MYAIKHWWRQSILSLLWFLAAPFQLFCNPWSASFRIFCSYSCHTSLLGAGCAHTNYHGLVHPAVHLSTLCNKYTLKLKFAMLTCVCMRAHARFWPTPTRLTQGTAEAAWPATPDGSAGNFFFDLDGAAEAVIVHSNCSAAALPVLFDWKAYSFYATVTPVPVFKYTECVCMCVCVCVCVCMRARACAHGPPYQSLNHLSINTHTRTHAHIIT